MNIYSIYIRRNYINIFATMARESNIVIVKGEDEAYTLIEGRSPLIKTCRNTTFRFRNIDDAEKTTLFGQGVDEGLPDLLRAMKLAC